MKVGIFGIAAVAAWCGFAEVIEYREALPELEEAAFTALTNRVAAGDTLLIFTNRTVKAFSWRTEAVDRLFAWPKEIPLERAQLNSASWRRIGRGLVVQLPAVLDSAEFRTNLAWNAALLKDHGLWCAGYSCKPDPRTPSPFPQLNAHFVFAEPLPEPKRDKPRENGYWADYDWNRVRPFGPCYRLEGRLSAPDGSSIGYQTAERRPGVTMDFRGVWVNRNYLHGRARLETWLKDLSSGEEFQLDARDWALPEYLEVFLPNGNGWIALDREKDALTVGVRINDELKFQKDEVKLTLSAHGDRPQFETTLRLSPNQTQYAEIPLAREIRPGAQAILRLETIRYDGRPVRLDRRIMFTGRQRYCASVDQDGMWLKGGAERAYRFTESSACTNFANTAIAATWRLDEPRAMLAPFCDRLLAARRAAGPLAPLAAQIAMDAVSEDLEGDRRSLKTLAALAVIGGANGIDWDFSKCTRSVNALSSHAEDVERYFAALGSDFAGFGYRVTSADGVLYAKVMAKGLLVVSTERFATRESILRLPALAGRELVDDTGRLYKVSRKGELELKFAPDEVRAFRLKSGKADRLGGIRSA